MRKLLLLSALCGLCVFSVQAQVTLKGVAVKMNSAFTPVEGVEVVMQGSVPTLTDGAGTFIVRKDILNRVDVNSTTLVRVIISESMNVNCRNSV